MHKEYSQTPRAVSISASDDGVESHLELPPQFDYVGEPEDGGEYSFYTQTPPSHVR